MDLFTQKSTFNDIKTPNNGNKLCSNWMPWPIWINYKAIDLAIKSKVQQLGGSISTTVGGYHYCCSGIKERARERRRWRRNPQIHAGKLDRLLKSSPQCGLCWLWKTGGIIVPQARNKSAWQWFIACVISAIQTTIAQRIKFWSFVDCSLRAYKN